MLFRESEPVPIAFSLGPVQPSRLFPTAPRDESACSTGMECEQGHTEVFRLWVYVRVFECPVQIAGPMGIPKSPSLTSDATASTWDCRELSLDGENPKQ